MNAADRARRGETAGSTSRSVPELAEPLPELTGDSDPLAPGGPYASVALTGRRSRISEGPDGTRTIELDGQPVAELPRIADARTVSERATELGVERRLRVGRTYVVERIVVPWDGPFCLLEWTPEQDVDVAIGWRIPDRALVGAAWCAADRALTTTTESGCRLAFVSSAPVPFDVHEDPERGVHVRGRAGLTAGGALRLAVASARNDPELDRALRSAARSRSVVRSRQAWVQRMRTDRLTVVTPDPAMNTAVDLAKLSLALTEPTSRLPARPLRSCLARLAIGEERAVRAVIDDLADSQTPSKRSDALLLVLIGRYFAWTGDTRPARTHWQTLLHACHRLATSSTPRHATHLQAAVAEVIPVAEALGRPLADLKRAAGNAAPGAGTVEALRLMPGWSDPAESGTSPRNVLCDIAFGLLGAEPDAGRGRLTIRPRPRDSWSGLSVEHLTIGSAALSLTLGLEAGIHRIAALQERGAAPLTLVLEPELPGRLRAARVDGRPAELDPVEIGPRSRVPIQIVLDHERRVELEMETQPR